MGKCNSEASQSVGKEPESVLHPVCAEKSGKMRRTLGLRIWTVAGIALLAVLEGASFAGEYDFSPPGSHSEELGVPGFLSAMHPLGYDDPANNNCASCHGSGLKGGVGPSCYLCHGEVWLWSPVEYPGPAPPPGGPRRYPDSHTHEINGMPVSTGEVGWDCWYCHYSFYWTMPASDDKKSFWHAPGHGTPLTSGCTQCHGPNLDGVNGIAVSCTWCHQKQWAGAGPPPDHTVVMDGYADHKPGYEDPYANGCARCHGPNLTDGFATSCYSCHRREWDDHNFSGEPWLPAGEVRCFPCHEGPDWNHALPTSKYTVTKTTLASVGQPNGTSAECMGCHEGEFHGPAINDFAGNTGGTEFVFGSEAFGIDLAQHHPVSFDYDNSLALAQGALRNPNTTPSGLPAGGTIHDEMLESGQVQCTTCHNPHDNSVGQFLVKPVSGPGGLCFTCHFDGNPAIDTTPIGQHHIPNRAHPWAEFSCRLCHGASLGGLADGGVAPACDTCHISFSFPDRPATGHHGGNRFDPLAECASCHDDPDTPEQLDGAPFGTVGGNPFVTPACDDCHGPLWTAANRPPFVRPGDSYSGIVDREVTFDASGTVDPDGDAMEYTWVFGDGASSPFPSSQPTITHAYSAVGTYTVHLAVTDGINDPVVVTFDVEILAATDPPITDLWDISTTVDPPTTFQVTFENTDGVGVDGVLTGVKDESGATSVVFGMEMSGVIFWMDIRMDPVSSSVLWGVEDTYFGNVDRASGTMAGVVLNGSGGMATFSGIAR